MNKGSFVILLLTYSLNLFSQKNSGFEEWYTQIGIEQPKNWNTLNLFALLGNDTSCKKIQYSHTGNFAALIKPIYIQSIRDTISGILTQTIDNNSRPESFCIFYKYSGIEKDSAQINLNFYKGTISNNNLIGSAYYFFSHSEIWLQACSSISWITSDNPDSLVIQIQTSNKNMKDSLIVDDFEIKLNSKIENIEKLPYFYFNQVTNECIFKSNNSKTIFKKVIVRNCNGQSIFDLTTFEDKLKINSLPDGIYFFEVIYEHYRVTKKVVISN